MSIHESRIGYLDLAPLSIHYERAANGNLAKKPFVIVGTIGNRGLVTAVSSEAFRAGVRPGLTPDSARIFVPDLKIVEERPALYYDASRQVNELCERFVPYVDPERQDGFVLDLTGTDRLYPDPSRIIRQLQKKVSSETLLTSRAGFGASRLIARLAANEAHDLDVRMVNHGDEIKFLADKPVMILPGIGKTIAERLRWMGVYTVRQLASVPEQTLEAAFGPKGIDIARAANGHDPRPRRKTNEAKPISKNAILEHVFYNPKQVKSELRKLVCALGLDLRGAGLQVRSITLGVQYPDTPMVSRRKRIPPADLDTFILPVVEAMYTDASNRRVRLRGLSLTYSRLVTADNQLRLEFARDESLEEIRRLEFAIDKLRLKYGVDTLNLGCR
ncbi:MAG TPA: hypothetical protein VGB30_01780 [bacterium]|jgi:DNA polymerase-4